MLLSSTSFFFGKGKGAESKNDVDIKLFRLKPMILKMLSSPKMQVIASLTILISIPLALRGCLPRTPSHFYHVIINSWDGLIHLNNYVPMVITLSCAVIWSYLTHLKEDRQVNTRDCKERHKTKRAWNRLVSSPIPVAAVIISILSLSVAYVSIFQVLWPSSLWHPFLWGYGIYLPDQLNSAAKNLCLTSPQYEHSPLCLSNTDWDILSSGSLSNARVDDVETVMKGLNYFQNESGGLVLNVLSRNTIESIKHLRENVDILNRFIPNLTVLIFENDSIDGSREAFKKWREEEKGYKVNLMECEEAQDCKLGDIHRYKSAENGNYLLTSAIGRMPEFRQRLVDFVLSAPELKDYTHMMVLDMDLQISLSPLGILHSIGRSTEHAIASSCRQSHPSTLGSITLPYDFTAFRPTQTKWNKRLLKLHERYCMLAGPGHRWRNVCDVTDSLFLILAIDEDRNGRETGQLYPLDSAYNGAMLYPIELVRSSGATYDKGFDGQRCEHIGFNLGLKESVYVNPKWDMHIYPSRPGGPVGWDDMGKMFIFLWTTPFTILIGAQMILPLMIYVSCMMILGTNVFYPFLIRFMAIAIVTRRKTKGVHHLPLLERKYSPIKET